MDTHKHMRSARTFFIRVGRFGDGFTVVRGRARTRSGVRILRYSTRSVSFTIFRVSSGP